MQRVPVAIVGGGITGIAAALKLAERGVFDITLFEKQPSLGGLDSSFSWEDLVCDRFYHVVLPTDTRILRLLDDLGLGEGLYWRRVRSGFYGDGRLVPLSTLRDFWRFPFLSFWQRVRLALGIVYSSRLKRVSGLDGIYAPQWLERIFGREVYGRLWEPLLRSKLGDASERTSAAFMGATIRRLYGARKSRAKQEKMGYWRGGYNSLLAAAEKRLCSLGVLIRTNEPVREIRSGMDTNQTPATGSAMLEVSTPVRRERFGRVLITVPCPEAARLLGRETPPFRKRLAAVEYLGIISVLLLVKKRLSPYYVINILDRRFPFTGIIESTNVIPPEDTGGKHLLYLPKYVVSGDALNDFSDGRLAELFSGALREVFPEIRAEDILHREVFRDPYAQPIPALHSLANPIESRTPIPHVYLANTAMIPDTLHNNNANIALARKVAQAIPGPFIGADSR
jgi:protoporphyrinogen oxidase